jgi:uncharacterized protein
MFTTDSGHLQPVWAFVLSAFLSAAAFYLCSSVAFAIAGELILISELIFRPLLAAMLLVLFSWLLTTADHVEAHRLAAMGLPRVPGFLRQFFSGSFLGFLLVALAVIPIAVWGDVTMNLRGSSRTPVRLVAVLVILVTGALAEELLFRGYPFQRLQEGIGSVGAIAVFSLMFGAVHLLNPGASIWGLINTILIGVVLSIAYLRTRALWLPWGIHFAWNATLGLLLGLPVSGLRVFNVAVRSTAHGPLWLTGGSYGVEASLSGALAVLFGLAVVGRWPFMPLRPAELPLVEGAIHPSGLPGIQN